MKQLLFTLFAAVALSSCADLANLAALSPNYPSGPKSQAQLRAEWAEMNSHVMRIDPSVPKVLVGTQDANGHMHMKPGYDMGWETRIEQDDRGYLRAVDHYVVTHNGVRITD
jgi:hypothetical protein